MFFNKKIANPLKIIIRCKACNFLTPMTSCCSLQDIEITYWLRDRQFSRSYVNKSTANTLRLRMARCKSLFYVTHNIKNSDGKTDEKGNVPAKLIKGGYKVYNWPFDNEKFAKWIEDAYNAAY